MPFILFFDRLFSKVALVSGALACFAMLLLLLNVFYDVVMRYVFNDVSIGMQEMEWHLYALVFLLGVPYAIEKDGHVRVDILFENWSDRSKAWINLLGVLIFILPFVALVSYYGFFFAMDAYNIDEGSGDPGGLPNRWIIKFAICLSFLLIGLSSLGMVTKALRVLVGKEPYPKKQTGGLT